MTAIDSSVTAADRLHFFFMSLVHETLYSLLRNPEQVLQAAGLEHGQRVLEVGCGPGFFTVPAAEIVGDRGTLTALDISPLAIARVREKIGKAGVRNVETVLADAAQTGLPSGSFDLIFLFGLEHHKGEMDLILPELWRLLKPAGTLATEGELWRASRYFYLAGDAGKIRRFRKVNDGVLPT